MSGAGQNPFDKAVGTAAEAVADVHDGDVVAIGGFGVKHGFPSTLIRGVAQRPVRGLTLVCNSIGGPGPDQAHALIENHQVSRLIACFSARPGIPSAAEEQIRSGDLAFEIVPQGVLVERLRAGGSDIPAFYSRVGVGTEVARALETREFGGDVFVLTPSIRPDVALVRASVADRHGNAAFHGSSQNLNLVVAKSARHTVVEAERLVEAGELDPSAVHLPGIFVDRVVAAEPLSEDPSRVTPVRRDGASGRSYFGKPALTRAMIAERVAALLEPGSYVNLGTGIPTLLGPYARARGLTLHAENGVLGYGPALPPSVADPNVYNAGGTFVALNPGASFFDSVTSFEIARSGRLDAVVLGAYQVDAEGTLANWSTSDVRAGGVGGAMDLVSRARCIIVTMEHLDSRGRPKLVPRVEFPLTRASCVDVVVTDLALFRRDGAPGFAFVLEEVAAGFSVDEVRELTPMPFGVAPTVTHIQDHLRQAHEMTRSAPPTPCDGAHSSVPQS